MKGKGEQQTYWLVGEDPEYRARRSEQRTKRRSQQQQQKIAKNGHLDVNGHCIVTRSSLKNKNNNNASRSPIPRCSSFESPKKLRFASGENLENYNKIQLLEVIADSSPCKKTMDYNASTSCPCIENLANSAATLASVLTKSDKPTCFSVPTLYPHLGMPIPNVLSAPASPGRPYDVTNVYLSKYADCEESLPWKESAPLLKISKMDEDV